MMSLFHWFSDFIGFPSVRVCVFVECMRVGHSPSVSEFSGCGCGGRDSLVGWEIWLGGHRVRRQPVCELSWGHPTVVVFCPATGS